MKSLYVLRGLLLAALGCTAYVLQPFSLSPPVAAGFAVLLAGLCLVLEKHLRQTNLKHLLGAAVGCFAGLVIASLLLLSFRLVLPTPFPAYSSSWTFLQLAGVLVLAYIGLSAGAAKGDMLNLSALGGVFGAEQSGSGVMKLLDTSVIIDGRIADIAETGFLEGTWGLPQFVLRELQLVADSADSAKRNRGRRGLDILQRLQKMQRLELRIMEEDFPQVRDVDLKLIELAKLYSCKIVTNDFNLNKVAQVRGVEVLNINELANTLKPIVLPGETMRVFILKEGKEYNQGVAYLDDGTMVVVDHARRMIGKNVDVIVTSVLQTTAGKMIFGKIEERQNGVSRSLSEVPERPMQQPQPSAAGGPALP